MSHIRCGRNLLRQILHDSSPRKSDGFTHPLLFSAQGLRFRKLEVILTTSMDNLGKAGQTVEVAPGYFRNYLMPRLLAVPNTDKFAYLVKQQRKIYQCKEEDKEAQEAEVDKMKEYLAAAKRLDNAKLVFRRFYKIDNIIRDPVTKEDIVAEVARQLFVRIAPENIYIPSPLPTYGEYEVPLRFPKSMPLPEGKIMWTLKVKIRKR